jgi:hypothetical protein
MRAQAPHNTSSFIIGDSDRVSQVRGINSTALAAQRTLQRACSVLQHR